jgi:Ser/Thr protein kinase RdoA (MazF antagonist)
VNDVYTVQAERGHYMLKVYRAGWRTHAAVSYEVDLLLHLHAGGVAVANPLATRTGSFVQTLHAPEGERAAVLYCHAPGAHFSIPFHQDERECALLGQLLARVHSHGDGFASLHARPALDLGFLLEAPLQSIQPFLASQPELFGYLCDLANRLRAFVTGSPGRLQL